MRLVLEESLVEKIECSFSFSIRLDPCNAGTFSCIPASSVYNRHREALTLLHRHRRGCQFQERDTRVRVSIPTSKRHERPEYIVAWIQQLLAATESQTLSKCADLIVDQ